MNENENKNKNYSNHSDGWFWGLFLILAAACLIFGKLKIFNTFTLFSNISLMRMLLAVLFVALLIRGLTRFNLPKIFFSIAFLGIIFEHQLGIESITPWYILLAALLLSIGCSLLFHKKSCTNYFFEHHSHNDRSYENASEIDGECINIHTTFGESTKYITSDNFERANLKCSFGAATLYFDNAMIQNGNAVLHLDVSFAGVELFVPKSWRIINKADFTFGALEEKNRCESTGNPTLTIIGNATFAGVELTYI